MKNVKKFKTYRLRVWPSTDTCVGHHTYAVCSAGGQIIQHHRHCCSVQCHLGQNFARIARLHLPSGNAGDGLTFRTSYSYINFQVFLMQNYSRRLCFCRMGFVIGKSCLAHNGQHAALSNYTFLHHSSVRTFAASTVVMQRRVCVTMATAEGEMQNRCHGFTM